MQWCSWVSDYETSSMKLHNILVRGREKFHQMVVGGYKLKLKRWWALAHINHQHSMSCDLRFLCMGSLDGLNVVIWWDWKLGVWPHGEILQGFKVRGGKSMVRGNYFLVHHMWPLIFFGNLKGFSPLSFV